MGRDSELTLRFRADVGPFKAGVRQVSDSVRKVKGETAAADQTFGKFFVGINAGGTMLGGFVSGPLAAAGAAFTGLGRLALASGKAVAEGLAMAVEKASEFEQAMAHVKKVIDAGTNFDKLRNNLLNLSTTIPVASSELAKFAQLGAQMGISGDENLTQYADLVARLAETSEMAGESAAMMLARIAQVNQIPTDQYSNLASAIVGVADKYNATTEEVMRMTMYMQAMGAQAGLSAQEMIGLSAVLASAGMRAQSGGTAMGRLAREISLAVQLGGDKLKDFAEVSRMSSKQFKQAWATNKSDALLAFFSGLAEKGEAAGISLKELGLQNVRISTAALSAARSSGQLNEAIGASNELFEEGTAIYEKSATVFETTAGTWKTARGVFEAIGVELGSAALPGLRELGLVVADGAREVLEFVQANKELVTSFGSGFFETVTESMRGMFVVIKTGADYLKNLGEGADVMLDLLVPDLVEQFTGKIDSMTVAFGFLKGALYALIPGLSVLENLGATLDRLSDTKDFLFGGAAALPKSLAPDLRNAPTVGDPINDMLLAAQTPADLYVNGPQKKKKKYKFDPMRDIGYAGGLTLDQITSGQKEMERTIAQSFKDMGGPLIDWDSASTDLGYVAEIGALGDGVAEISSAIDDFDKARRESLIESNTRMDEINSKYTTWKDTLSQVTNVFRILGVDSNSTFGRIIGGATVAGAAMADLAKSKVRQIFDIQSGKYTESEDLSNLWTNKMGDFDLSQAMNSLSSVAQGLAGLWKASSAGGAAGVLGGAASGAQLGSLFGGIGSVIGGGAGALLGGIKSLFGGPSAAEQVGKELGLEITDELAETIKGQADKLGLSLKEASLLSLSDIAKETGKDAREFGVEVMDLMSGIADGSIPAAQGIEQVGEMWGMVRESAEQAGLSIDGVSVSMIQMARKTGTMTKDMQAFVDQNIDKAIGGANALGMRTSESGLYMGGLDATQVAAGDPNAGATIAANAQAQGTIYAGVFWAAVKEKGVLGATDAMRGSFEAMQENLAGLMPEGMAEQILGPIQALMNLTAPGSEEEGTPAALFRGAAESAMMLSDTLEGIANSGYMTTEMMVAFGQAAQNSYQQAINGGATEQQSIQALMPYLQQAYTAHEQLGIPIDANTQKLMDMAQQQGMTFQADPLYVMKDILLEIAKVLGADIPASAQRAATAIGNIPAPPDVSGYGDPNNYRDRRAPDGSYSLGFYSPSMPMDKIIKVHQFEEVSIKRADQKGRGDILDTKALVEAIGVAASSGNRGNSQPLNLTIQVGDEIIYRKLERDIKAGRLRVHTSGVRSY